MSLMASSIPTTAAVVALRKDAFPIAKRPLQSSPSVQLKNSPWKSWKITKNHANFFTKYKRFSSGLRIYVIVEGVEEWKNFIAEAAWQVVAAHTAVDIRVFDVEHLDILLPHTTAQEPLHLVLCEGTVQKVIKTGYRKYSEVLSHMYIHLRGSWLSV